MNTKIRTILAAGMLLVTVLPVAACAKKAPSATTVPTTAEVTMTETDPASPVNETEASETQTETVQETTEAPVVIVESVESVRSSEQTKATKTAAKKTAKKTSKKTTKTTKKAVKETETKATSADKTGDKTVKETEKPRTKNYPENYSLGNSVYTCKDITIKMFIKKNDYATISVVYKSQDRNDRRREVYYTMSGKVDRKTNTMKYTNCTKQELIYTDLGLLSNKVDYKNGKGEISFKKNYKLVWTDSMQHFADSLTFSRTA